MTENGQEKTNEIQQRLASGVPLGGIGTGAIELGRDSRFRNITINNNRDARTRIPVSSASFLAVRVANEEGIYSRILQQEFTPQDEATEPPRLQQDEFDWHSLYPQSDFQHIDEECPAKIYWSGLAPIIPYDLEASSLPAIFMRVKLVNLTKAPLDCAVVFNWENLVGVTRERRPDKYAPVTPVHVSHVVEHTVATMRFSEKEPESGEDDVLNGLQFGTLEHVLHNADGQHCLAVKTHDGTTSSVLAWDHEHLGDWRTFWTQFRYEGDLMDVKLHSTTPKCGAVCSSFRLAPEEAFSVDFVLSWFCPRYVVRNQDLGVWYETRFKSAVAAAREGLRNLGYYSASVHNWQQRFLDSSLPLWLTRRLINSCHVFSTNTFHTREAGFALVESPEKPLSGRLDDRVYSSLAVLLFYPRLEWAVLQHATQTAAKLLHKGWVTHLGELSLDEPRLGGPQNAVLVVSNLVITAYRNYIATGALARAQELYPQLKQLMGSVLVLDKNRDLLPDVDQTFGYEEVLTPGLTSYAASIWVCALRVMAEFSHCLRNATDSAKFTELFQRARVSFEERYWDETREHYRWYYHATAPATPDTTGCHAGELAGQWLAAFLGLGTLFSEQHMHRALKTMQDRLAKAKGVANLGLPPDFEQREAELPKRLRNCWLAHTIAHHDCLMLDLNHTEAGYKDLEAHFSNLRRRRDMLFDIPAMWDLQKDDAYEEGPCRQTSLLAIWYTLFAIQGFYCDVPRQHLVIAPRLMGESDFLSTPIFTASSLGWLRYREVQAAQYMQQVRVSFESPMMIRSVELRLPEQVHAAQVVCELPSGIIEVEHEILDRPHKRILIHAKRPLSVSGTLAIDLRQVAAAPARVKGR